MIIPNNQPEAPLVSAILEFDAEIDDEVLIEEKQKRIKNGSSIMYDTTAFNFTNHHYSIPFQPFHLTLPAFFLPFLSANTNNHI